ncbi:MAG TPA: NAD-dependent epimerase/dehydratase family protein, partial [Polyangiales bacterium]|nr:NAD-dependent epimerase/dehydratase family protein [Polyangiales bacterium]
MSKVSSAKVLVTGGSGFLGTHVIEELERRGARSIVRPRSSEVDLTDARAVRALFERERPDLVLHLAAKVGGIGANQRTPGTFFRDNMAMGLHVLEEARRA